VCGEHHAAVCAGKQRSGVYRPGIKSLLTHSIIAKPDIKRPEQLKGKRIGVSRIGSNPHYFAVQALRHFAHRIARGELYSGRRRTGNVGRVGRARHRRGGFDRADRCASAQARLSLRRLWTGFENCLRRDDVQHAPRSIIANADR